MSKQSLNQIKEELELLGFGYAYYMEDYEKNGEHIEISIGEINLNLKYGADPFFIERNKESLPNLWYVFHSNDVLINKGYRCFKKAIKDGIIKRQKILKKEQDSLKEFKRKFKAD